MDAAKVSRGTCARIKLWERAPLEFEIVSEAQQMYLYR